MNRRWHKIIVFVLLVLALIDVAGVCPVDAMNLPSTSSAYSLVSAAPLSDSNGPFNNSEGPGDGCFCFCAHMILAPVQTMGLFLHSAPVETQRLYIAIEAPLASPYHPPRS
jgi:hypothetical protein